MTQITSIEPGMRVFHAYPAENDYEDALNAQAVNVMQPCDPRRAHRVVCVLRLNHQPETAGYVQVVTLSDVQGEGLGGYTWCGSARMFMREFVPAQIE